MSTTQRYIDLAGVSFRAEAESPRPACSGRLTMGRTVGRTTSSNRSATPA